MDDDVNGKILTAAGSPIYQDLDKHPYGNWSGKGK